MGKFRTKPVIIEAIYWDGNNIVEVVKFLEPFEDLPNPDNYVDHGIGHTPAFGMLDIPTKDGMIEVSPGSWIIKDDKGDIYTFSDDYFEETYERVPDFFTNSTMNPIMKYFSYDHLPSKLQHVSSPFADLAISVEKSLPNGPEKSVALRKLLEAKDAAVRSALDT